MQKYIFISYSTQNSKIAFQLVDYLESCNVKCWIAPRNIASGHDYTDTIDSAIKHCNGFILIFSEHSAKSVWVKKEVTLAISEKKNIIPFKITNTDTDGGMNFMLNNLQWIVGVNHPEHMFPEILEGLKRYDPEIQAEAKEVVPVKPTKSVSPKAIAIGLAALVVLAVALFFILRKGDESDESVIEPVEEVSTNAIETQVEPIAVPISTNEVEKTANKKTTEEKATKSKKSTESAPKETKTEERATKVEPQAKVEEPVVQPKEPEPVAAPVETKVTKPTATETPAPVAKPARNKKYDKALSLYNARRYSDALKLFEELKAENCTEKNIDTYIRSCKQNL